MKLDFDSDAFDSKEEKNAKQKTEIKKDELDDDIEKIEVKKYIAEYIVDLKDSEDMITVDAAKPYYNFLNNYLNSKQNNFSVKNMIDSHMEDEQLHLFVQIESPSQNINKLFELMNSECSLAYVEVMVNDDYKVWGDIIRLFQNRYFDDLRKEHKEKIKLNEDDIQDDEGWIPLEKLKEGLEKNHVIHKENKEENTEEGEKDEKA